jgi:hypothetical protein
MSAAQAIALANADASSWLRPVLEILNEPPVTPLAGERYLIASEPPANLGQWETNGDKVAEWSDGAWVYTDPEEGMFVYNLDTDVILRYELGVWEAWPDAATLSALGATLNADTSLVGNGYFLDEDNMISDDATKVPSQQSVKAYVDSKVVGLLDYKGPYDATTDPPVDALVGDAYTVTVGGTGVASYWSVVLEPGDMIICASEPSTTEAAWTVVQKNVDQATETVRGIAFIALNADVAAETDDEKIVTPLKLQQWLHKDRHVSGGTDPIRAATNAQDGLATDLHIQAIEANTTHSGGDGSDHGDVAANTAARHVAVTVTDTTEVDFTLIGQDIQAALKIASIANSKLENMVQNTIKGRITASPGAPEDLTAAQVRTLIDFDAQVSANSDVAANTAARHVAVTVSDTAEVDLTLVGQDISAAIVAASIANAKLAQMAANTVKVNATAGAATPTDLAVGANTVLGRQAGNLVAAQVATDQVANNAITYAKMQNIADDQRLLGNVAGAAQPVAELTATQVRTLLNVPESGTDVSFADVTVTNRLKGAKGADVVSANDITLGDGNYFDITGTGTINTIAATDWTAGSVVILQFDDAATVAHNQAGTGASILLSGSGNFVASAGDTLTLVYDGTTWRETARTVI